LRTVLLLKSEYDRIGGPESILRSLAPVIDGTRFQLVLATLRNPGQEPLFAYPDCLRQMELPWRGLGSLMAAARHAARLAEDLDAVLLHTHDMRANAVAAASRLFSRRPWIAHVHGWLGATHHGRWRLYEAIDRRLVRTADLVLVGSKSAQAEVRACGAKRVELVANAVPIPDERDIHYPSHRPKIEGAGACLLIGMFGRLHVGKGHDIFLEALASLLAAGQKVRGVIVGEGPEGPRLSAMTRDLGISGHVTFTGFVDDPSVYFPVMDIVVVPSLKESLPITALEAMSFARPVVASRAGDLPALIDDGINGFLCPIGDSAALAERIKTLADDVGLRRCIGAAAHRRIVSSFSVDAMARDIEAQYESVIAHQASWYASRA
jgi:glycosyltransferase involved in cell wall biosynthesis